MKVAVIPARGGSKRIPRKNIREFCGMPMIAHSILSAQKSMIFDKIIVSTDDEEIADVVRAYGVEVPFLRPRELSDDFTGTVPVISHAVKWIEDNVQKVTAACCIYATAPFITSEDLIKGLQELIVHKSDYAFSVTHYPFPIQRAIKVNSQGRTEMFFPEHYNTRSQDLEEALHDAGQFYWGTSQAWLNQRPIFSSSSVPVILPRTRVQDIDTQEDWDRAEQLFYLLNRG
ncbi:pseudaminic acid cytidylyltransferase [Pantoea trifolii]|uniref:Pseudaminic acid cytidylyltransferase n=1 Tax=Pantoea trifolii TaxID=2968030 RepID=A0ABT1VN53_9GAMM|nr:MULTISPECIES: pseudaminic acid cytidylyltransferase [unclassified Pantoea]MCQ8228302.1 pseudaminic acid cytidylyltransferase [Pantoea sp. MMK2]MCQ8236475.1 pseudaminic acid cytidylyltransferase [Pantoea sp. MMK3]